MKVYADGMEVGKETGSISNALMENLTREIKVGDSFAILGWTDRYLWQVTKVISQTEFHAKRVRTTMRHWAEGTQYPVVGADGKWELCDGDDVKYKKSRKYWYEYGQNALGEYYRTGHKVHFSWGATTGYCDPSF